MLRFSGDGTLETLSLKVEKTPPGLHLPEPPAKEGQAGKTLKAPLFRYYPLSPFSPGNRNRGQLDLI